MLRVVTPAPLEAVLATFAGGRGWAPRRHLQAALWQHAKGQSGALYRGDQALAVMGLIPLPDEPDRAVLELWFSCRPEFAGAAREGLRRARLTLRSIVDSGPVVVRAYVRRGHEPGRRMARLVGMRPAAVIGDVEEWEIAR